MKPERGWVYRLDEEEGARARAGLVLSEPDWNRAMGDSVIVPLYDDRPTQPNPLRPPVGELWADCTLIGGVPQDWLVEEERAAGGAELNAVVDGVRLYLDIDALLRPPRLRHPPSIGRSDWWPGRGEVFYGKRLGEQRELYAVITSDEWNVRNDYATCAFITSRFKAWRERWQIAISAGGYAISGDIEPLAYTSLDHRNRHRKVRRLTQDDLKAFASGLVLTLQLQA